MNIPCCFPNSMKLYCREMEALRAISKQLYRVEDIQGAFFDCSSQFSVPKWKMMGSQSEILFHEILDVQKILVGWTTLFFEIWAEELKKTPSIYIQMMVMGILLMHSDAMCMDKSHWQKTHFQNLPKWRFLGQDWATLALFCLQLGKAFCGAVCFSTW